MPALVWNGQTKILDGIATHCGCNPELRAALCLHMPTATVLTGAVPRATAGGALQERPANVLTAPQAASAERSAAPRTSNRYAEAANQVLSGKERATIHSFIIAPAAGARQSADSVKASSHFGMMM